VSRLDQRVRPPRYRKPRMPNYVYVDSPEHIEFGEPWLHTLLWLLVGLLALGVLAVFLFGGIPR
jgi:hypothetical protein